MGKPVKRRNRRALGSRPYKNYSEEMLHLAVENVKENRMSSRSAEKTFGIPRRTILNKVKEYHNKNVGTPTRLSLEEEKSIVQALIAAGEHGCPLTKLDLRLTVFDYVKKNNRENLFNGKPPGKDWVTSFLDRHADELSVRSTQNIKTARAQKSANDFLEYFQNLEETVRDVPPSNILNLDETNLSDDPGNSKCIFRRGVKYPERVLNSSKGAISLMFSAAANGTSLSPYVVYKADNLYSEWIQGGPRGARYNRTSSGWFDSTIFEDYFKTVVLTWAGSLTGRKVVICDNLSSHLSLSVIKLCQDHNISFVFIPPNSTHLTQPLDVAIFAPLKKAWRKILLQYKMENPNQTALNKNHFPKLLTQLIKSIEMNEAKNIKSGFRATGIYPYNPREVLKKVPECAEEMGDTYSIDNTLLEYLKTNRKPKPLTSNRNKKVLVEPGKSVTIDDFQNQTKDIEKRTAKKKSALTTSTTVRSTKSQMLHITPSTASVNEEEQVLDNFENELDFSDHLSLPLLLDRHSIDENYEIEDMMGSNEKYDMNRHENEGAVLPSFIKMDILDEKTGAFHSQINPTSREINVSSGITIRESARTNIILKPKRPNSCKENTNALKIEKPKILSCFHIPATISSLKNIIYDSDHNKENMMLPQTRQTIEKQNDHEILTKVRKIKEIKAPNGKQRAKKNNSNDYKVPKEKNMKGLKIKGVKKRLIRKYSESSNSDVNMSIHSDSDICGIASDQDEPGFLLGADDSKLSAGSKNKVRLGKVETMTIEPPAVDHCSVLGPSTSLKYEEVTVDYKVGEYVLVRYFFTKKVDYYVGIILEKPRNGKVKIYFLRKVGKNDNTKFIKVKSQDIELIDCKNIVKTVELLTINEAETDFVLGDDDDYIYFD